MARSLVDVLLAGHAAGRFTYLGTDDDGERYRVKVRGGERTFTEQQARAWLDGLGVGEKSGSLLPDKPPGDDRSLAPIRSVLVNPSLADQIRIATWVAMEEQGVGVVEMARRIGATRKTVREGMRYGHPGHLAMRAALGRDPDADPEVAATSPNRRVALTVDRAEPAGLARVRIAAYSHEVGLVRLISPLDPNQAQLPRARFILGVVDERYGVAAADLRFWLTGLAEVVDPKMADRLAALFMPRAADGEATDD